MNETTQCRRCRHTLSAHTGCPTHPACCDVAGCLCAAFLADASEPVPTERPPAIPTGSIAVEREGDVVRITVEGEAGTPMARLRIPVERAKDLAQALLTVSLS